MTPEFPDGDPRRLPWCDVSLLSLSWEVEGRDLLLLFRGPRTELETRGVRRLCCSWVDALNIDLSQPPRASREPLTWDATFSRADHRWEIRFDFASDGEVSFRCNDVRIDWET